MNKQQAIYTFEYSAPPPWHFVRTPARYQQEFDTLFAATAAHQRLVLDYPGPYNFRGEIVRLDSGKYLVLGTWDSLGD